MLDIFSIRLLRKRARYDARMGRRVGNDAAVMERRRVSGDDRRLDAGRPERRRTATNPAASRASALQSAVVPKPAPSGPGLIRPVPFGRLPSRKAHPASRHCCSFGTNRILKPADVMHGSIERRRTLPEMKQRSISPIDRAPLWCKAFRCPSARAGSLLRTLCASSCAGVKRLATTQRSSGSTSALASRAAVAASSKL